MNPGLVGTYTIQINPRLLTLLSELDEFKGAWRALGARAPDRLSTLRRVAWPNCLPSSRRGARKPALAPAADCRGVRRALTGDPSVSGWQWAPEPHPDNAAAAAGGLRLHAFLLAGMRGREQQGSLLPCPTPGAGHRQQQKYRLAEKIDREMSAVALSDLAVRTLDYVKPHGRVTTWDMVHECGASPNTLKSTFGSLVGKSMLVRRGGRRSIWYSLM